MKKKIQMERKWNACLNQAKDGYIASPVAGKERLEAVLNSFPLKTMITVPVGDEKTVIVKDKGGWHYNGGRDQLLVLNVLRRATPGKKLVLTLPTLNERMSRSEMATYITIVYILTTETPTRRLVEGILDYAHYHVSGGDDQERFIYSMLGNSVGISSAEIREMWN